MGINTIGVSVDDAGEILSGGIVSLMKKAGMPNGLSGVGYTTADVDRLVDGTLPQQRVIGLSPRPFDREDLKQIFIDSMTCW
jgi:alcohol dehydrogenase class IV